MQILSACLKNFLSHSINGAAFLRITAKKIHTVRQPQDPRALRARLAEAEKRISELQNACMVENYAGHDFIESMNEGALTLEANGTILYANPCFAHMVVSPREALIGASFQNFFSKRDKAGLRLLLNQQYEFRWKPGAELQMTLHANDGSCLPTLISFHLLRKKNASSNCGTSPTVWWTCMKPKVSAWPVNCTKISPN